MSKRKVLQTVWLIVLLFSVVGCVVTQPGSQANGRGATDPLLEERNMEQNDRNKPYRLGSGDVIDVKFYFICFFI